MTRVIFLTAGCICLVVGAAGVVLPLLPGTPLLLLAAFCFARSSPRLHEWLVSHPRFGPTIAAWERERAISVSSKRVITVSVVTAFSLSFALLRTVEAAIGFAALGAALLTYIWTRPAPGSSFPSDTSGGTAAV